MRDFFADKVFLKQDFTTQKLPKGDYENCTFEDCQFQEGFLDNQLFVESQFVNCNMTNTNITNTQFNSVVFTDCKLIGVRFETCNPQLFAMRFERSNLSLASFYEMDIGKTLFQDCRLHQVDFAQADLTGCKFPGCDFENAIFESTILHGADLSEAHNFNIDPTQNNIKKARFSQKGLIGLLKKYDIVVEH